MWERTLTISSAGKTFAMTGWKIGWVSGPAALVAACRTTKQFLTYVNGAPLQPAVAVGLALDDSFYTTLTGDLRRKRDLLCTGLASVGFSVFKPAGTYFVTTDVRPLGYDDGDRVLSRPAEARRCRRDSAFGLLRQRRAGRPLVRFAFCKRDEVLLEAVERLLAWGSLGQAGGHRDFGVRGDADRSRARRWRDVASTARRIASQHRGRTCAT